MSAPRPPPERSPALDSQRRCLPRREEEHMSPPGGGRRRPSPARRPRGVLPPKSSRAPAAWPAPAGLRRRSPLGTRRPMTCDDTMACVDPTANARSRNGLPRLQGVRTPPIGGAGSMACADTTPVRRPCGERRPRQPHARRRQRRPHGLRTSSVMGSSPSAIRNPFLRKSLSKCAQGWVHTSRRRSSLMICLSYTSPPFARSHS